MEEEKDQILDEVEDVNTKEISETNVVSSEAEEKKNSNWILWVMGAILIGLIVFLVFYVIGKPGSNGSNGDSTDNTLPPDNGSNITIDSGEVIAKVGSFEITDGMATERAITLMAAQQQLTPEEIDLTDPQVAGQLPQAKNFALSQLVDEKIIEEYAKKENLTVTDADLSVTAQEIIDIQIKPYVVGKDVSSWDENDNIQWESWLTTQGFGADEDFVGDFVMRYPKELTSDTYKRMLYGDELNGIKVSESQARSWFEAPGRIRLAHILYSFDSESDPKELENEARSNAEKARLTVLSGEEFSKLAFDVSQDPSAKQNRGDLGWYQIIDGKLVSDQGGTLVTEFEQAALRLKLGEVSPVVQTQFGFHVIKVIDATTNGARYDMPEGMRIATINFLNNSVPEEGEEPIDPEVKAKEALSKILSGELDFQEAVSQYSDDQMTKANGGEMPSFMATDSTGFFWVDIKTAVELDGQGMYPYERNLVEKLWKLEEGKVYPEVIQVSTGWIIGKVIAHRKENLAVFSKIKDQVVSDRTNELKAEFERNWMQNAREELGVEYLNQPAGGQGLPPGLTMP